jgi:hypothetical protein
MKKLIVLAMALSMVLGVSAFAQDTMKADDSKMAPAAPLKSIKGTVKQDGDKITFVTDKDMKSWDVKNPETLKDHVGHHVLLSAHIYADTSSIHVMSVKMLKAEKM